MTSHLSGPSTTVILTGREIDWFRAKTIAIGLETWAKHKIKVNRAYTPKAMMAQAQHMTGKTFKPTDYVGAASALRAMILLASKAQAQLEELRNRINEEVPFDLVVAQARLLVQTADRLEEFKYPTK